MERQTYCLLALAGGGLALLAALCAPALANVKMAWALLVLGGVLAIVGALWAFSDIETGSVLGISVEYRYGLHLTLAGGILAFSGILGVRG